MPLSYIMTPDISSPAVSDDVIIVFLNAEQGVEGLDCWPFCWCVFGLVLSVTIDQTFWVVWLVGWCHLHCVREQEFADQMVLTNKQSVIAQTDSGCVWKCHKVAACILSLCSSFLWDLSETDSLIPPQKSPGPSNSVRSEEIQAHSLDRKGFRDHGLSLYCRPNKVEELKTAGVHWRGKFFFTWIVFN